MHLPRPARLLIGYLTTDMNYVLMVRRFPEPATDAPGRQAQMAYLSGGGCLNWASWQVASLLGIALAQWIPPSWGLGFAGILALVGVSCSLASSALRRVSAGVAGAAAVAAFALPYKLNIVVAIAAAVALCLLLEPHFKNERTS
jgi:predicted branched-subunit amino acid permease